MKSRRIYYRKKGKSICVEGKQDGKSVLIWTLPNPEKLISELIEKASYFSSEKAAKIGEKIRRLDFRAERGDKPALKVRRTIIKRTPKNDAETLWKMTK